MKKLDVRLIRMIKSTKGQYIALLFIVITGIFIYTAMSSASSNLSNTLQDYYDETNFADISATVMKAPDSLEHEIVNHYNIKDAERRYVLEASLVEEDKDEKVNVRIISVNESQNKINKLYMKSGKRQLSYRDIIIIDQFAAARNINVGDKINLQINGRQYSFNVSGIASSPEFVYLMENEQSFLPKPDKFGIAYIEEDYLRQITGGQFNEILLTVENQDEIKSIAEGMKETLKKYGVKRIVKKDEQLSNSMLMEEISGLEKMSSSVPIVFLLFAAVMMVSMLSRIVKKDRMSIGVMKALGYTDTDISFHYIKYAVSVGIIGGIAGTAIGVCLAGAMTQAYLMFFNIPKLTVKIYYDKALISIMLACIFCIGAGVLGAREVMKINPAESMKPEPPKNGKRIFLENIKPLWNKISFTWKIVLRNIFRQKKKFVFISLAVAMTYSLMIMSMWVNDLFNTMFNLHYSEFMKMDYNISFSAFEDESIKKSMKNQFDIDYIEGRIEFPFELENGRNSKTVNVIGLEDNTKFYGLKNENGDSISVPDEGMIISSNLAKSLDVSQGSKIFVKNLMPEGKDRYVTVKGIIDQTLGINAYMNIDYLNKLFLDQNIINGVYVYSDSNLSNQLINVKNISSIQSSDDMKNAFKEFTGMIVASIGMMIMFSGILGFVIIYSMTIMSINERILEFSSLRIMGFTKGEIFRMILKENMVMSVVGMVMGWPLGVYLIRYVGDAFSTDLYTMKQPVSVENLVISFILTLIFMLFAQIVTYSKIHRLDFIQALKNRES